MPRKNTHAHDDRFALVAPLPRSASSLREVNASRPSPLREVNGSRAFAAPRDIYGGSRERLLASLKRLTRAGDIQRKSLTSLTVFHLVEMELLARDERGNMQVTPLGARTLQEYERAAHRRERLGDTAASPPSLFTVRNTESIGEEL